MTEEILKTLKTKRSNIKGNLTRFVTFLGIPENRIKIAEIKERIKVVQQLLQQFEEVSTQIEVIDETQVSDQDRLEFEDKYYQILSLAQSIIQEIPHNSQMIHQVGNNQSNIQLKLPDIKLPVFSGSFTEWITFRDSYKSLIHENQTLNEIQKFYYLKSSLTGEAIKTINHLTPSLDNYNSAWQLLQNRYENNRLITYHHIRSIFSIPSIQSKDGKALRQTLQTIVSNLKALEAINRPTQYWDDLLVYFISSKFDYHLTLAWENMLSSDLPTMLELIQFLTQRCQTLDSLEMNKTSKFPSSGSIDFNKQYKSQNIKQSNMHISTNFAKNLCLLCKDNHNIYQCQKFLKMSVLQRQNEIKRLKLCVNCMRNNHKTENCSSGTCKFCGNKHNSLLHQNHAEPSTSYADQPTQITVLNNHCAQIYTRNVLLSTALIKVMGSSGKYFQIRALLDNGSQNHFITENACSKLGLKFEKVNISVAGLGNNESTINRATHIKIQSNYSSFKSNLNCLVVPTISMNHPLNSFDAKPLNIPAHVKLADPQFNISNPIDLLIGNEIFWNLLKFPQIQVKGLSGTILQNTQLGFIVHAVISMNNSKNICSLVQLPTLNKQLEKFWDVETFNDGKIPMSQDNKICETLYQQSTKRDKEGRFTVNLPFKNDHIDLGYSRESALQRFNSLEHKLLRNPNLYENYKHFIVEYLQLEHMEKVTDPSVLSPGKHFYMPHHGVLKNNNLNNLRVVFDGSAKSSNGKSLNDNLFTGPALQQDLKCILLRFRTYEYVISADIKKMYRQILIHPDHQNFQLILWRNKPHDEIETYRLKTVTYGLSASPYLAIKSLQELAKQEAHHFPNEYDIVLRDFYVDDLLTGANDLDRAKCILKNVTALLAKGCFNLCKFASNSQEVLKNLPSEKIQTNKINLDKQSSSKTLGIYWDTNSDNISFSISFSSNNTKVTKRHILSLISKLFDPLGLVSPITIIAKTLLQKIWLGKFDWDEELPIKIRNEWFQFVNNFQNLPTISIPRKIVYNKNLSTLELHGFSDASETSYGACVYLRTIRNDGSCKSHLLCSKNRVAPLKTSTIPRLELCAALLLTQLVKQVTDNINIEINKCLYWTDSKIVLAWLQLEPSNLKIFVAHRVAEIQSCSNVDNWRYVRTSDNPADILSRGTATQELSNNSLWWHGPSFLNDSNTELSKPDTVIKETKLPELKTICCLATQAGNEQFNLLYKFSSYTKLIRITAYCIRFINKLKTKETATKLTKHLNQDELKRAETYILKLTQKSAFSSEIHALLKHGNISTTSSIKSFNPFLDESGLLRIGGRLKNANINFDSKHQIILPRKHYVTNLIIIQHHKLNLHAGCQSTLSSVRNKFWPIAGITQTKSIIKSCVICKKAKPISYTQIMGDLPHPRVNPSRPFHYTGVDYAGPLSLKNGFGRTNKTIKIYIVIFVCFATRAVHIELASNYTAATFLNVVKRFISRRGKVLHLFSDNGTNFTGAKNELFNLKKLFEHQSFDETVIKHLCNNNINWHFIPPRSPNFGGLWESAVKSTKTLLKRVVGKTLLNYEEMHTILTMVEACLNSRPLTPLSNDPSDLQPLTPSHFLIGEAMQAPPEPDLGHVSINRLSRYQLIEQLKQSFWKRWSREILQQLQRRTKWTNNVDDSPQIGDLVILKEDNLPPLYWAMGRITELHPGSDGKTRVVSVKTMRGVVKRAISKVCSLLNENQE